MGTNPIQAYRRGKHRPVGIRNHILILPTVFCSNSVVSKLERHFENTTWGEYGENAVIGIPHQAGCCHQGFDYQLAFNTLLGAGSHPNVGGCLVVGFGCGQFCGRYQKGTFNLISRLRSTGIEVHYLEITASGGTNKAVKKGIGMIEKLLAVVRKQERETCDLNDLTALVLNGGSDPTSGLFSNPTAGHFIDYLVHAGGSAVFSQTSELCGAEGYFLSKCSSDKVRQMLATMIGFYVSMGKALQNDAREGEPTPGNIEKGLDTIAEKSLGNSTKIGHDASIKIQRVLPHSLKIPSGSGLYFMEGPGQDLLGLTGMFVGGATFALFTTGWGSPLGHALAPVIKMTANRETYDTRTDNLDFLVDIDEVVLKGRPLKEVALESLKPFVIEVINGKRTKAEINGQRDFAVRELWMLL